MRLRKKGGDEKFPSKNQVMGSFFLLKFKDFVNSSGVEAFFSAGWFVLPCLYVYRFTGFWFFWCWVFCTFWALCFAFSYVLKNSNYKQGALLNNVSGIAKSLYISSFKK